MHGYSEKGRGGFRSFGAPPVYGGDPLRGEADHRIANNLALIISLVRMRGQAVGRHGGAMAAADVQSLLEDIATRVEAVARLHRMLSQSYRHALVDFGSYARELCASLAASLSADARIVFQPDGDEVCLLPPDKVLALGLLMGELITNSVKYAHPAGLPVKIGVGCRQTPEGRLILDFSDDGVGLPENFDPRTDGALGFRVVRALAAQLGAVTDIGSTELGLRFRLDMPIGDAREAAE